jgi:hypothetical protein
MPKKFGSIIYHYDRLYMTNLGKNVYFFKVVRIFHITYTCTNEENKTLSIIWLKKLTKLLQFISQIAP